MSIVWWLGLTAVCAWILLRTRVGNCIFAAGGNVVLGVLADTDYLRYLVDCGLNPVNPESLATMNRAHDDFVEEVRSTDPFEVRLTFSVGDPELTLTLDEELRVTDAERTMSAG